MTNYRPWPTGNFPRPVYGMPQQSYPSVPLGGMGMGQQRMNQPSSANMAQRRMVQQQQHSQTNFKPALITHNPLVVGSGQPVATGFGERRGPGGTMADVAAQDALTLQQLTSAEPHQQKQIIREHLYRKIYNMYPQLAGKITGTAVT